ncbi:MAG: hypothetical protein R2831_10840 [Chitinophagaceae bacterium]
MAGITVPEMTPQEALTNVLLRKLIELLGGTGGSKSCDCATELAEIKDALTGIDANGNTDDVYNLITRKVEEILGAIQELQSKIVDAKKSLKMRTVSQGAYPTLADAFEADQLLIPPFEGHDIQIFDTRYVSSNFMVYFYGYA